jgi:nitrous oxidase accessory protein
LTLFALLLARHPVAFCASVPTTTVKVCPTCQIRTIAQALAITKSGGLIEVGAGVYKETNLLVDKPLSLMGEPGTIIDGTMQASNILVVKANDVSISGITFKNTGVSYVEDISGVRLVDQKGAVLSKNQFINTNFAIYAERSQDGVIRDNVFAGTAANESGSGNGIHIWQGKHFVIERNEISGHRDGIYFEFVDETTVSNNQVTKNIRYGLHFMRSDNCTYKQNIFKNNGAGVAVMYSRRITMQNNDFVDNTGVAAYGLLLKDIKNSLISDNVLSNNTTAIFMEETARSRFENNQIDHNGLAILITGDCDSNTFSHNNIVANTFDVTTNSDFNPNTFEKNYWSHYDGYDLDHDGIGDIPYRSVSLSSVILERVDSSFILIRSFLFNILDEIERHLPELVPERMKDEEPLMNPLQFAIRPGATPDA